MKFHPNRNLKRGQIFEVALFFLVIVMCGTVIVLHFVQEKNAPGSLVSPKAVFAARDGGF